MKTAFFSTREVAQALAVSESSVRRWCDQGRLASVRTAGGHRKVAIDAVLQFVRETNRTLEKADILGIVRGRQTQNSAETLPHFIEALQQGDATLGQSILTSAYCQHKPLSEIFDHLIGPAMFEIGNLWAAGVIGVDQERRACQIVMKGLTEIEGLLSPPKINAQSALGGTPEGDFAQIGTKMAELALRNQGWNTYQVGAGMPLKSLASACRRETPDLLWLSVIHLEDTARFVSEYQQHLQPLMSEGLTIVLGGREMNESILSQIQYSFHGQTMSQFEAFCQGIPRRATSSCAALPLLLDGVSTTPLNSDSASN